MAQSTRRRSLSRPSPDGNPPRPGAQVGRRVLVGAFAADPLTAISEHLSIAPQPWPEGGPDDVVVAIESASVGWVDLLMTSGLYQHLPAPPYVPGLESAGTVAWVGAAVESVAVGDRVIVDGFQVGPRSLGAYQAFGGFATWALAPARAVIPIPGELTFDQASNLLGSYETAWHCLVARGRLQAGETVLIHGATGATGLAAVHIAKILGATVIATGRSEARLAVVAAEGADHVLPSTGFRDAVRRLTGGRGADVVYDGVGGNVSLESLRCVRFGARYLVVGWASTPFAKEAPNALPTNLILMKGLDVLGAPMVIATVADPTLRAPRLAQVLEWAATGQIRPHVSHVFPLSEVAAAMRARWTGDVLGGCALRPG